MKYQISSTICSVTHIYWNSYGICISFKIQILIKHNDCSVWIMIYYSKFNFHFKLFMTTLTFWLLSLLFKLMLIKILLKKKPPHSSFYKYILRNKDLDASLGLSLWITIMTVEWGKKTRKIRLSKILSHLIT